MAGYWDWYIQDDYQYMSASFKSMFGYEDHELENHPHSWQKIIHPNDLTGVFHLLEKHVKSKGAVPFHNEVRYFHKDGSIVWVYFRGKVIQWDNHGRPLRMVGSHVDITPLKNAELTEVHAKELQQKNHELEQFMYVTSHDLQEPMNTVVACTNRLSKKLGPTLDEESEKFLEYIEEGATRATQLIKGLVQYFHIGKNPVYELINSNDLLNDVCTSLQDEIKDSSAVIDIADNLPTLYGVREQLTYLFHHLIYNGIKFRSADRIPEISVSADSVDEHWKFAIEDNGIGIDQKYKDRIFYIFQRLNDRDKYNGIGIGLSHCHKIVGIHNGKIWVESNPRGGGSTFYFTLPKSTK